MNVEHLTADRLVRAEAQLGVSRASRLPGLDGIRKTICLGPEILVSMLIVSGIALLLPAWLRAAAGLAGIAITAVLITGVAESLVVRMLFRARKVNATENERFAAVLADLCSRGLGPPVTTVYVSHHGGSRPALGIGRRSVILRRSLIRDLGAARIGHDEAVALIAHAALVTASGRMRLDLAIRFWSAPWRAVSSIGPPQRGVLGFAWKARPAVFGVAIWQSYMGHGAAGPGTGVVLALILASTYLMPRLPAHWEHHVDRAADQDVSRLGLGPALASILRRDPPTSGTIQRIHALEQIPHAARPLQRKNTESKMH